VLSYNELYQVSRAYQSILEGAQLQGIWSYHGQIIFAFYKYELFYLIFQFKTSQAQVVLLRESDLKKESKRSLPVTLFANAHLKNQRLVKFHLPKAGERILQMDFAFGMVQFWLIPGNINLAVANQSKTIWLKKPISIQSSPDLEKINAKNLCPYNFSFELEFKRYQLFQENKKTQRFSDVFAHKKQRIIKSIEADLEAKDQLIQSLENLLRELLLKQDSFNLNLAKVFRIDVPKDAKWFEVKESLYALLKKVKKKRATSEQRLKELQAQSQELMNKAEASQTSISSVMKRNEIKGRFFEVKGFVVVYSKSGIDGLKLIRAAQPWDLWLHIRDGVGAHFILKRNKGQNVTDDILLEVSYHVLKVARLSSGAVLVTEVRFVTPIKGVTPGLVKYTHERVIWI